MHLLHERHELKKTKLKQKHKKQLEILKNKVDAAISQKILEKNIAIDL